ncbi:gastric triacylglycerol lipase [Galendromus occidentalis]|uniref:Gastric triacylglycerol lipase n=1 Tax=Galendromus occidentalis TaxID=34638 RepID=A0AAJ6VVL0_9ACAR|nr:gastric triacylglycerol lipase [Galendromus occidentalis]
MTPIFIVVLVLLLSSPRYGISSTADEPPPSSTSTDRQINLSRPSLVSQIASSVNSIFGTVQQGLRQSLRTVRQLMLSDPDAVLAMNSIGDYVRYNGYTFSEHLVSTTDGVILQVHRIRRETAFIANQSIPVLMLPGVMTSSFDFIANLPHQSVGFFLADMGYDVWLGNFRGTRYGSMSNSTHPNIYNATLDDQALLDTPAMIDAVLNETGFKDLHVVAHSKGATGLLATLSDLPEYNSKVRLFSALAPAVFFRDTSRFLRVLWRVSLTEPIKTVLKNLMYENRPIFNNEQIFDPSYWFMTAPVCAMTGLLCESVLDIIEDPSLLRATNYYRLNRTRLGVIMSHFPAGTTFASFQQFYQIKESERFQKFNFDDTTWIEAIGSRQRKKTSNLEVYGKGTPPEYDLANVNVSMLLFYADNDVFAGQHDITLLNKHFGHLIYNNGNYHIAVQKFLHMDFLWGLDARQLVYDPMYYQMKTFDAERGSARSDESLIKDLYYTVSGKSSNKRAYYDRFLQNKG